MTLIDDIFRLLPKQMKSEPYTKLRLSARNPDETLDNLIASRARGLQTLYHGSVFLIESLAADNNTNLNQISKAGVKVNTVVAELYAI